MTRTFPARLRKQQVRSGDQKRRVIELALEKARYETSRIRRQYDAVDPDNRLVAGELESRWNDSLQRVAELEQQLASEVTTEKALTEEQKQSLMSLGSNGRSSGVRKRLRHV